MLNITAKLKNLRTNQTYTVNYIPAQLAKLQIKGAFNIKFPFGFNRGISSEKVKFVKNERQLLLDAYAIFGASAKFSLSVFYANLQNPVVLILDFTDFTVDSISIEIGFKITPLLDRCRNFEKANSKIDFAPTNFTLKTVTPQNFQANFNHNSLHDYLDLDVITIANIQSEGLIDANGLEYNCAIPDKNDAIAIFRVTQKTAGQTASYFNLNVKFQYLKIKMYPFNGTITLKLKTDYLFYYTDSSHDYVNIIQDVCSSAVLYKETEVQNAVNLPKNVNLSDLPYDHLKNLAECYIVTYLEVDAPYVILQNAIRIWCNHIFISHNFIQIDEIVKGVRMSDYLQKVNDLAGEPIFDTFLLFLLDDIVVSSTNFMLNFNQFLECKLMDILEALSIVERDAFVEKDGKYFLTSIVGAASYTNIIELTEFTDVNYEPLEQIIDFEIGDETEVKFKILPRLFEKRKYYTGVDTLATLDTMIIKPKIITSGEVIINKLIDKKYDDNLLFLKIENIQNSNYGSFGPVLNQFYSNQNVINRLAKLLNSFFTTQVSNIKYRNDNNQVITQDLETTEKIFNRYYRNITTPASNSVIAALTSAHGVFLINGKKYLSVEYSLNLEPNTFNIKLLEML